MNKLIFEKEGFVLVNNIFSHEDVCNILNLIDNYIKKHKDKFEMHEINYTKSGLVNSIHCLHKYDSSIIDYVKKNEKFMNNINTLLDDEVEIVVAEAFLKPPGEGMPSPNHQDNNLWCLEKGDAFTCWIALDDIDEKNGGLKLWKRSHKVGALQHEESFKPGTSQTLREEEYQIVGGKNNYLVNKLKAGDIQFHHSLTVHGSDANLTDRSRRVLTVQVFSKKDSRCPILWKKYKDSLMKQKIENKGLTVSLIEKTISCEDAYQILDDPWGQIQKENSEKFNLITFFSNFLYNEKNCKKFLELGSGLGLSLIHI